MRLSQRATAVSAANNGRGIARNIRVYGRYAHEVDTGRVFDIQEDMQAAMNKLVFSVCQYGNYALSDVWAMDTISFLTTLRLLEEKAQAQNTK